MKLLYYLGFDKNYNKFSYTILYTNLLFVILYILALFILISLVLDLFQIISINSALWNKLLDYFLILSGITLSNQGFYQLREFRKKYYDTKVRKFNKRAN